jgi:transcriptional regulator with XRE-family HTH domain
MNEEGGPMAKRRVQQVRIVERFGARLRELRLSRGMTQAALAQAATITPAYVWKLESGRTTPGIDLLERLANALGTTPHDLLPLAELPDVDAHLRERARALFETLLDAADHETLLMLCPLLQRLAEGPERRR